MIFWIKFAQKGFFPSKTEESKHHHWIQHIPISLHSKFYFKQIIRNFGTKFIQKRYFQSRKEKGNITIEFCIFELVTVGNFSLNWQFWISGPNLLSKYAVPVFGTHETIYAALASRTTERIKCCNWKPENFEYITFFQKFWQNPKKCERR